jgi:hypothetical protein
MRYIVYVPADTLDTLRTALDAYEEALEQAVKKDNVPPALATRETDNVHTIRRHLLQGRSDETHAITPKGITR